MVAKSTTGLKKETAAAIAVLFAPTVVVPVILLLLEKDVFVRFHAVQILVVGFGLFVLQWVLAITIILLPLVPLISIFGFIVWLILVYKAWMGEKWEVPFFGKLIIRVMDKL